VTKADLSKQPQQVSAMFDAVAANYDRTNDLLSFGQARFWRKAVRRAVKPRSGQKILDLAAGTGTSSLALTGPGVTVVAADFSEGMLAEGRRRYPELQFEFADAMQLPFADASFEAVTISFGLRNVHDHRVALAEMHRVLKPEGRLVICEFSHPRGLFGGFYRLYLHHILPRLSKLASPNPEAYGYLAESIAAWPKPADLAKQISATGFVNSDFKMLTAGIVALHTANKPKANKPKAAKPKAAKSKTSAKPKAKK
jgi:demethylmenaquinone methyltransferase/2-methoxy-6-polyprenyl-1,4-benzoquinol methylase